MNDYRAAACAAAVMLWPCSGAAGDDALTLERAFALAREHAPAIVAARAAVEEARARLVGAAVWLRDNPEVEGDAGARLTDRGELLEAGVGVRQVFELGGQRAARMAEAEAALERESAGGADVARRVLRDAAVTFYAVLYAEERQRLAQQAQALAEETLHIAERRHRAGDLGILDVELAAGALARGRSEVEGRAASSEAALGALRLAIGAAGDEPLHVRGDLRDRREPAPEALLARVAQRADLQALEAEVREAHAGARLGRAAAWPDLGLGAAYQRDEGENVATAGLTLTLPVFEHGQGARAEASAREQGARWALDASRRAAAVEVQTARHILRRREEAVRALEGAVARLDGSQRLAQRGYEVGELSVAELLAVRREILETRREYLDRLLDAAVAAIELEAAAGVLQ